MATCPIDEFRNGEEAVKLATNAIEIDPSPQYLDTLAAAYAEIGYFEDAIKTQEKIINELTKKGASNKVIEECQDRLKSYKNHMPWREEVYENI